MMGTDVPVGGACRLTDLSDGGLLTATNRFVATDVGAGWTCGHLAYSFGSLDIGVRCVRPLDRTGEIAEGCTCPQIETPTNRIFYVPQAVAIPANELATVASSCPEGTTLIGGSCNVRYPALLLGEGPYPGDPQRWHCSWYGFNGPVDGEVEAICLDAPGPDAVTGELVTPEVVEHRFADATLPANGTYIAEVTCAPGDTLLSGGCQTEDPSPDLEGLRLMGTGMADPEDNRPDTWQCSWTNTTALTPKTLAVATCLKPAATSATE